MATQLVGDVQVTGNLEVLGSYSGTIDKGNIVVSQTPVFALHFDRWRVWDAYATLLPATPATDDLGLVTQTFGSGGPPYISTGDVKALGTTTRRARFVFAMPAEYVAARGALLRLHAGMLTTIADTSCTLDVEAFTVGIDTAYDGVDMVTTAAQNINNLTFAAKDFQLDTGNGIAPGDFIDVRVTVVAVDGATATAVIAAIAKASLVCTTRG